MLPLYIDGFNNKFTKDNICPAQNLLAETDNLVVTVTKMSQVKVKRAQNGMFASRRGRSMRRTARSAYPSVEREREQLIREILVATRDRSRASRSRGGSWWTEDDGLADRHLRVASDNCPGVTDDT